MRRNELFTNPPQNLVTIFHCGDCARPNSFKFEWLGNTGKSVIRSVGSRTFGKYSFKPEPEMYSNMRMALAASSGVTLGASSMVASLLMPDEADLAVLYVRLTGGVAEADLLHIWTPDLDIWLSSEMILRRIKWLANSQLDQRWNRYLRADSSNQMENCEDDVLQNRELKVRKTDGSNIIYRTVQFDLDLPSEIFDGNDEEPEA